MKHIPYVLIILLLSFSFSEEAPRMQVDAFGRDNFKYPSGSILGLGGTVFTYQTEWSTIVVGNLGQKGTAGLDPIHIHEKKEILLFLENRSMFNMGPIHIDVRGEIRFGVSGETKQDYLTDSIKTFDPDLDPSVDLISISGTNWAGGAQFKFAYPFDLTPRVHLAPFAGLGLTFVLLEQSGDKLNDNYKNTELSTLSYESGWNEFSLYSPVIAGLNLDFETWSIIVDYRRSIWGTTFTSWKPKTPSLVGDDQVPGPSVKSSNQIFQGIGMSLAFRIGR